MRHLGHFLRIGLLGFITLFVVGTLIAAGDHANARRRYFEQQQQAASAAGQPFDAERQEGELLAGLAREQFLGLLLMGLVGGVLTIVTAALLRVAFPVGPASKIVIGALCGPFLPLLIMGPRHISQGHNPDDLGGITLLAMLLGALAGLLEANRIFAERARKPD